MAEILSNISTISYILAAILFVLAIFLFFWLGIAGIIGDLSGRTARKSIERLRKENERSGSKSYRPSKTNAQRGKLTDAMPEIYNRPQFYSTKPEEKEKKKEEKAAGGEYIKPGTGLLRENRAITSEGQLSTGILVNQDTGLLQTAETEVIAETLERDYPRKAPVALQMLDEVIMVHSREVI